MQQMAADSRGRTDKRRDPMARSFLALTLVFLIVVFASMTQTVAQIV
jgi:hypothetical protein